MREVPRVGVAGVVEERGKLLALRRAGSHGEGTWGLPGGHPEMYEHFFATAEREVAEETGLRVEGLSLVGVTHDPMPAAGKHYVTLFVACRRLCTSTPQVMEPAKATALGWFTRKELLAKPDLFLPLRNWLDGRRWG